MKKLFSILTLFVVMSFTANAQFKKGDKFVEGTLSYTKPSGSDATYGISPTVGTFLTDKIAIGVSGEFSKNGETKTTNIGVFARNYFLNVGKSVKIFSALSVMNNSENTSGEKTSFVDAHLGLGLNYFVTEKLALTTHICDLVTYCGDTKEFSLGFSGVNNPLVNPTFGVLYRF